MLLPDLVPARVLGRRRRFSVEVDVNGEVALAHLANSGRLEGLLAPGTPALLRRAQPQRRLTQYDVILVQPAACWVAVDARLANPLLKEALQAGRLRAFAGYDVVQAEARSGHSRIDFLLSGSAGRCLVETKSVTLVSGGVARFPDAPTLRGARQLADLVAARRCGYAAALVFVVQREDAAELRPNAAIDPAFCAALHRAAGAGVSLLAFRCSITPSSIELTDRIPVRLQV